MHQALAPRIAAFPKCYMDDLCVSHTLSLLQWIDMSGTLSVDGLEMYPGFFSLARPFVPEYCAQRLAAPASADAYALCVP